MLGRRIVRGDIRNVNLNQRKIKMQIPEWLIHIIVFPIAIFLTIVFWKFIWWLTGKIIPKKYQ